MLPKSYFWKTALLLCLLLSISVSVADAQETTLTLYAASSGEAQNNFLIERADQFTADTGIAVEVSFLSDFAATMQAAFAGGTAPDVFLVSGYLFPFWADAGYIQPNDNDWLDNPEDFYPALLDAYTMDETTRYCAPYEFSSLTIQYNVALFEAAGVDFPTPDWTWDELSAAAQGITQALDIPGLALPPSLSRWAPFIFANDDELIDGEGMTVRVVGSQPGAISYFLDLFASGAAIDPTDAGYSRAAEAFVSDAVAMIIEGNGIAPYLQNTPYLDWNVVELPMSPLNQNTTVLFSSGACVSAQTSYSSEAWQLVNYLTGYDGAAAFAAQGFAPMPGRQSAIETWVDAASENFGVAMNAFAQNAFDAEPWTPHTTASGNAFLPNTIITGTSRSFQYANFGADVFAWARHNLDASAVLAPLASADELNDTFGSSLNSAQEAGGDTQTFDEQFLGRDVGACSRRPRPCYCYKG